MRGLTDKEQFSSSTSLLSKKSILGLVAFLCIGSTLLSIGKYSLFTKSDFSVVTDNTCPILPIKVPESFKSDNSTALSIIQDENFRNNSIKKLAGAIQIDTVMFDHPPEVDEDPTYFEKFKKFHKYLETTFPLVYENLDVTTVNTYGLVFTWKGSDESLKPLLLTAHQDVVPVQQDSLDGWSHPPFEGYYDGKYLYGRGSSDCKNLLISIMESLELLISNDFRPSRTILAAFGFDEETGGLLGAKHISKYLEDNYGKDSLYAIIDEGASFMTDPIANVLIAAPLVAEKGYVNIDAQLRTPGGHSSSPPDHTSIGIVSELVYLLENNPFDPVLTRYNPVLTLMQCIAAHFGENMPPQVKDAILKADFDSESNKQVVEMLSKSRETKYFIKTSQAIDIIRGGEKVNALPEAVFLSVNHRIAMESSIKETVDRFMKYVKVIAHKYNLGVTFQNETIIDEESKDGVFHITLGDGSVEPTPAAPANDTVWEYLAGSSRHLMHDLINPDLPYEFLVTPMLMPANTDTKHYHALTKNIFRYSPGLGETRNIHSIDESIEFDYHLHLIAFFYEYIQTIDTPAAEN